MNTTIPTEWPSIVRTGRGVCIAGTRITLYHILDYLHAGWSPRLVQQWLDLTDVQMTDVMEYIAQHRDEIEQEYQQVLQRAEQNRRYWETRQREHLARREPKPLTPEQVALRARFQTWRSQAKQA